MFTAALFIIAKTWKQSRGPSVGEWINYGAPRNGILFSTKKEMNYQAMKKQEQTLNAYY